VRTRETWLSRRCRHWSIRLLSYCPARKGTAYSLSLHSVRMCSAVLRYVGRLRSAFGVAFRVWGGCDSSDNSAATGLLDFAN
jgi:hypothetical protein